MKRKLHLPALNPVLMELALVLTASAMMSVVVVTTAYMIYVRLTGP